MGLKTEERDMENERGKEWRLGGIRARMGPGFER